MHLTTRYRENINDINHSFKYLKEDKILFGFALNNWHELKRDFEKSSFRNRKNVFYRLTSNECAIWLNAHGDVCYRLSIGGDVIISSWKKIGIVFYNLFKLDIEIKIYDTIKDKNNRTDHTIYIDQLVMIEQEVFNPSQYQEFYAINKTFYKNTFKPSNFLTKTSRINYELKNSIILSYIYHLSNQNRKRFDYIINWLANMFNTLTKSNIALILVGNEESGKDILFNDIIKPLFGFEYCIEVDDTDFVSKHFDKLFKDKLFYNFNEISYDVVDKNIKNICKEMIENDVIYVEQNHKETYNKINNFAQVLITTSKPYIPIIDINRVNFTIFNVTEDIKKMHILKKDERKSLYQNIKNDLQNFTLFLRSFKVDINLANEPFEEDDKDIILDYNQNIYEVFIDAIKNKDKEYFKNVKKESTLYKDLLYDFDRDRIKRVNLIKYFSIIYPDESVGHTRTLLKKLREIDENLFDQNNINSSNSEQYFNIL